MSDVAADINTIGNDDGNGQESGHEDGDRHHGDDAPPLIKPIAPSAIQRIVAGQAVTDLSSAVKELVDNAIDASAGRVCVKLYDQGLEAIEVSDNGDGVPSSSRPLMAMKHATSKLRQFDDLYQNRSDSACNGTIGHAGPSHTACAPTLGFRGEALFCLANLSRSLAVSTRTADEFGGGLGEQFAFDKEGQMIPKSVRRVPRPVGTTVTVKGLFENLPVRRVDLMKRIKVQKMKLIRMMQGYAILCLGTQFNVTDITSTINSKNSKSKKKSKHNKTIVYFATSESDRTLEASTASVMGTKFLAGLTRIEVDLSEAVSQSSPSTDKTANVNNDSKNDGDERKWKLRGLISHAPTSPYPSNARGLQFFSINGRPVDLPPVSRVLGDVWRLFDPTAEMKGARVSTNSAAGGSSSGRKRPACILAFTLPNNMYDVNLSPDKRDVMLTEETTMLELIREGLMALWTSQSEGKFASNEVETRSMKESRKGPIGSKNSGVDDYNKMLVMDLQAASKKEESSSKDTAFDNAKEEEFRSATPKSSRRNTGSFPGADVGLLVSPHCNLVDQINSSAASPRGGDDNCAGKEEHECHSLSSTLKTMTSQKNDIVLAGQDEQLVPTQRDNEMQHRQQDQRGWEQMLLKPQHFKELQMDMNIALPSDNGKKDSVGSKDTRHGEMATEYSSRTSLATNSECMSNRKLLARNSSPNLSSARGESKRQKRQRQDVASFLNSFAFGSSRPALVALNDLDGQSDNGNDEESEIFKDGRTDDSSREYSHKENDSPLQKKRNVMASVKGPRPSSTHQVHSDEPNLSSVRCHSALSQPSLEQGGGNNGENNSCKDAKPETKMVNTPALPPVEAVWNSFTGTQNVITQYQNARLLMKKSRKFLQGSSVKGERSENRDTSTEQFTSKNGAATHESIVNLRKEDFLHMSIIGQFNLEFILARCRNQNLWILDQHACDEKFNFERLCKDTIIHEQKLIVPLPLELSPSEEHCVLEHMDVFERNGFRFSYDPEKAPLHRLSLTALPYSGSGGDGKKAVQFGKDDVGALCAMLGADGTSSSEGYIAGFATEVEGSRIAGVNAVRRYAGLAGGSGVNSDGIVGSSIVRLPKAIAMFANRACRGSIMFGTALSQKEQVDILRKLNETDIPWNCAHGRPTMNHIRNLTKCLIEDEDAIASHVAGPSLISEE